MRPVGDAGAPGAAKAPADDPRSTPRSGEFDRVLERRQPASESGRARREGEAVGQRTSHASDGVPARQERRGQRDGGDGGQQEKGGGGRQEPSEWRALPGDIALPVGLIAARPEAAAASGVRAAEMAALVEQIAGRIVQAAELRLGPEGTAEARFSLNLAALGEAGLHLQRGTDGAIAVLFEARTAELARVLETGLTELVARLEARGLEVREIVVRDPGGATVRVEPGAEAGATDESRRQAEPDGRRHRQPEPEPTAEEERGNEEA
jgi:hypothetical protein